MGQKFFEDKIGALSQSSGTILVGPSFLTVGGQQYYSASLSRTISSDVTMTANSRYQIFAVIVGGSLSLRISANENSVGPAGFTAWKLVGSFYSNGLSPVAFGSFVNIEGVPTSDWQSNIPTGTWTTNTTYSGKWRRLGDSAHYTIKVATSGAPNSTDLYVDMPSGQVIDYNKHTSSPGTGYYGTAWLRDAGVNGYTATLFGVDSNTVAVYTVKADGTYAAAGTVGVNPTSPFTWGINDEVYVEFTVPISGWSNIAIKDL